jgi:hypothetical protein
MREVISSKKTKINSAVKPYFRPYVKQFPAFSQSKMQGISFLSVNLSF